MNDGPRAKDFYWLIPVLTIIVIVAVLIGVSNK